MLVLTRKIQQQIRIGDNITISILKVKGNTVRVGIEAPRQVRVVRGELPPKIDSPTDACRDAGAVEAAAPQAADEEAGTGELVASAMQRFMAGRCRDRQNGKRRCRALKAVVAATLPGSTVDVVS